MSDQLDLLGYVAPEAASEPKRKASAPPKPRPETAMERVRRWASEIEALNQGRDKLLVIDGNNVVRRNFHAGGRGPDEAIGHALGVYRRTVKPTHAVIVWDDDAPTWRHDLWPAYKAKRPPKPEGLDAYFEGARAQCKAWGLTQIRVEALEADDVIAAYVDAAAREGLDVVIVSGDKDLLQLVRDEPRVHMIDEARKRLWRPADVRERFGVWPHSFADYLALVGDLSDGYQGVPKIGEKTAAPLIDAHGGLEQLLTERIELVSSKSVRERLRKHADQARMCLQLATLSRDLRLPIPIRGLTWE